MKSILITLFTLSTFLSSFGQEPVKKINTIENQFDDIYRTSTTYQVYKVISKARYQTLKEHVIDSIKDLKKSILQKSTSLKIEKNNLAKLDDTLNKTIKELEALKKTNNSTTIFGFEIDHITYNIIIWSLIVVLLFGVIYFVYKFLNSNLVTKKAVQNLKEIEIEFEQHRKKSLVREQKLRRELQDEINKQRNV